MDMCRWQILSVGDSWSTGPSFDSWKNCGRILLSLPTQEMEQWDSGWPVRVYTEGRWRFLNQHTDILCETCWCGTTSGNQDGGGGGGGGGGVQPWSHLGGGGCWWGWGMGDNKFLFNTSFNHLKGFTPFWKSTSWITEWDLIVWVELGVWGGGVLMYSPLYSPFTFVCLCHLPV